jgi:hypothetical protein
MIIAVLISRFCDNNRRKSTDDAEIQAQRAYSQYFIAMLIGRQLLLQSDISLPELTHRNFADIKNLFEQNKDRLYQNSEAYLLKCLHESVGAELSGVNGRTIAAIFRRFDLVENYLKTSPSLV